MSPPRDQLVVDLFAPLLAQLLGIVQVGMAIVAREDHGCRRYRTGQRPPSRFIDPGHALHPSVPQLALQAQVRHSPEIAD